MHLLLISTFGARGDSSHFHDFFEKFYTEFFFPYLKDNEIETIIELGDIFDRRKYVNFDSLSRSKRYWFDPIRENNIDLHCIIGNHDVYFKNTNRVNSPSLLLQEYSTLHVYDEPTEVEFDGLKTVMLPWINSENYDDSISFIEKTDADIIFGHLEFAGFEMYRGAVNDHGLDHRVFSKFDKVMTGHFHHKSTRDNIHYLGAPYEMTWSDYDDPRGFHIFDTETKDLTYVENPYKMFHKVFYDDIQETEKSLLANDFSHLKDCQVKVVVKNKSNPYVFDLFVDRVNAALPAHLQVVEDNLNLDIGDEEIVNEAEDTITIINKYVDNLKLDNSKPVVKLLNDLYYEALTIE